MITNAVIRRRNKVEELQNLIVPMKVEFVQALNETPQISSKKILTEF
jgi:hypothetical protein